MFWKRAKAIFSHSFLSNRKKPYRYETNGKGLQKNHKNQRSARKWCIEVFWFISLPKSRQKVGSILWSKMEQENRFSEVFFPGDSKVWAVFKYYFSGLIMIFSLLSGWFSEPNFFPVASWIWSKHWSLPCIKALIHGSKNFDTWPKIFLGFFRFFRHFRFCHCALLFFL